MRNRVWLAGAIAGLLGVAVATPAAASTLFFDFNANNQGTTANASLFLFGTPGQTADVTTLSGFSQNVTLNPDGFFNLPIANSFQQLGTGVRNTGFKVVSTPPIAGYFVNRAGFSTDMTFLLDQDAIGTSYVIASQGGGFGEGSQAAIHATQDGTNVTFTPKGGAPIIQALNAGETFKFAGGAANLTGSTVIANKPVAVFAGNECAQVPVGRTFCDTLLEQMIPTNKLSSEYFVAATKGAELAGSDLVRVIATQPGTVVTRDGVVVATLVNIGDFFEFSLAVGTGTHIQTSAPSVVAQYLIGGQQLNTDPALTLIPGADTWLDSYRLSTPDGAQAFVVNYAAVVIATSALGSLELDGVAVNTAGFSAIGGTGFSRGIVDLPLGLFDLAASEEFLVILGGGSNADSYLTYGGSTFAPGISPPPPPNCGDPGQPPCPVPAPPAALLVGLGVAVLAAARTWMARSR
jgi:hypothetical protein